MTNIGHEASAPTDPDGSLFLPQTERGLEHYKLALLLNRGPALGKTPEEIAVEYEIADRELVSLRDKVRSGMVAVAIAPEI